MQAGLKWPTSFTRKSGGALSPSRTRGDCLRVIAVRFAGQRTPLACRTSRAQGRDWQLWPSRSSWEGGNTECERFRNAWTATMMARRISPPCAPRPHPARRVQFRRRRGCAARAIRRAGEIRAAGRAGRRRLLAAFPALAAKPARPTSTIRSTLVARDHRRGCGRVRSARRLAVRQALSAVPAMGDARRGAEAVAARHPHASATTGSGMPIAARCCSTPRLRSLRLDEQNSSLRRM